jgi:drug/metabolite transporter (DMT)-like permease
MAFLVAGAVVLAWSGSPTVAKLFAPAAIVGACIAWGLDNNFSRKVSLADALPIVASKGLVAGPVNLALGLSASWPDPRSAVIAAIVGFLCYGVSLTFYVLALRHPGTARTAAYFSVAPFFGAAVAVLLLGESVTSQLVVAGAFMALGVPCQRTPRTQIRTSTMKTTSMRMLRMISPASRTHTITYIRGSSTRIRTCPICITSTGIS